MKFVNEIENVNLLLSCVSLLALVVGLLVTNSISNNGSSIVVSSTYNLISVDCHCQDWMGALMYFIISEHRSKPGSGNPLKL